MPMRSSTRDERIELRTTKEEKQLLAAAGHERLDVTGFIMRQVLLAARAVVGRAQRIALSERDSARVLKLLENPPRPTAALRAAARRRAGARTSRAAHVIVSMMKMRAWRPSGACECAESGKK